jgi:hypothetical protein
MKYGAIIFIEKENYRTYEIWCYTQKNKGRKYMKLKTLLRTLLPLAMMGVGLCVALPLASCSCGNNDQPIVKGPLIDGSN